MEINIYKKDNILIEMIDQNKDFGADICTRIVGVEWVMDWWHPHPTHNRKKMGS
jgi:hypothetical protein